MHVSSASSRPVQEAAAFKMYDWDELVESVAEGKPTSDAASSCDLGVAAARDTGIALANEHHHPSPLSTAASAKSKPAVPLIHYVRTAAVSSWDSTASNNSARSPVERSVHLLPAADGTGVFRAASYSLVRDPLLPRF